jgi:hypothetical protein
MALILQQRFGEIVNRMATKRYAFSFFFCYWLFFAFVVNSLIYFRRSVISCAAVSHNSLFLSECIVWELWKLIRSLYTSSLTATLLPFWYKRMKYSHSCDKTRNRVSRNYICADLLWMSSKFDITSTTIIWNQIYFIFSLYYVLIF